MSNATVATTPAAAQSAKTQLIDVMSAFVNHLIHQQAAFALGSNVATPHATQSVDFSFPSFEYFCAEREPGISVEKYCERLVGYMRCSPECFVFALAYVRRAVDRGFPLSTKSAHRMLITALVVAAKTRDDHYYSMHYYAQVGGVTVRDLNAMEVQFLVDIIQFRANVCVAEYRSILAGMDRAFAAATRAKLILPSGTPLTPEPQVLRSGNHSALSTPSMYHTPNSAPSKGHMHPSSSAECDSHGVSQSTTAASSPKSPVTPLDKALHVASPSAPCCTAAVHMMLGRTDRLATTPIHAEWISIVGLFA